MSTRLPIGGRAVLAAILGLTSLTVFVLPRPAASQSCILTRLDTPVLNAFEPVAGSSGRWQMSVAWRYGKSDRHFVGTVEQVQRQEEGSQVINTVHLADLGLRYNFSTQSSLTVGVPFLMAERSLPIRDESRQVIGRSVMHSQGLGDITVTGHRLLWDPASHPSSNLSFGLGVKLPTGQDSVTDTRQRFNDGQIVSGIETVDESVQPGDGGFGAIVEASGYKVFASSPLAGYASATYIIAPQNKNGVVTFRSRDGEQVESVTDQYVARLGVEIGPRRWGGISVGIGGRIEGIPVHDLVGASDGFRRPGYMLSVEPSLAWTRGVHTISLSVPIAVQRNRQRSVPDLANGIHGDAAFPDYIFLAGYYRRF